MSQTQFTAYTCLKAVLSGSALGLVVAAILTPIMVSLLWDRVGPLSGNLIKACDQAVANLLSSNDLVEIQRSGIVIQTLACDVGRRLPREP